jgi:hypothetical protein
MAPNLGLGANNAIESAAVLVNKLRAFAESNNASDTAALAKVFSEYQKQRKPRAAVCKDNTAMVARIASFHNSVYEFICRYAIPAIGDRLLAYWLLSPIPQGGVILDFLEEPNKKEGNFKWRHAGKVTKGE